MTAREAQLLVLAKRPAPGRVKTRLTPPYPPQEAAALAAASLRDTLRSVAATAVRRRALVLDGDPDGWTMDGFDLRAQTDGGLDRRLEHAMTRAFAELPVPVLLIGMDTPQVGPADLDHAVTELLGDADAVLGPASDGGYWAIGLRVPRRGLVTGVPMSRPDTCARQHERLRAAGLRVTVLPTQRDVDDAADAAAVAAAAPRTELAALVGSLGRAGEGAA